MKFTTIVIHVRNVQILIVYNDYFSIGYQRKDKRVSHVFEYNEKTSCKYCTITLGWKRKISVF